MQGSSGLAAAGSFLWGIASIIFSPCHLSSIPLIIAYISKKERNFRSAFMHSLIFSAGILVTITAIGLITGYSGRMLGDLGGWGNIFLSVFFIFFGLMMFDIVKFPSMNGPDLSKYAGKGYFSSLMIGLVFGIGLGPCTFAFMAPVLGIVFQVSSESMLYAMILLGAFSAGHISVIVLAGTFTEVVEKYLKWGSGSGKITVIRRICGVLLIIAGIYSFTKMQY